MFWKTKAISQAHPANFLILIHIFQVQIFKSLDRDFVCKVSE